MLLRPPSPIFNVGVLQVRKVTIFFPGKSNIEKGEGVICENEATFPTLLSMIVASNRFPYVGLAWKIIRIMFNCSFN